MKSIFTYMAILTLLFAFGCNAENPICSPNFCAIGEVFPRSELDTATFSEVDIDDSVIFATLVATPTPKTPDTLTLATIVADVASGGTQYKNKIVTIEATVKESFESGGFVLATNNDNVVFFVGNRTQPELLESYQEGKSYTFTVFIDKIEPPETHFPTYAIWSKVPKDVDVFQINFTTLVESISRGSTEYLNRFVRFTATVDKPASIFTTTDTITVDTKKDKVAFFITNRTHPPKIMQKFQNGQSYEFTVFLANISDSDVLGISAYGVLVFE